MSGVQGTPLGTANPAANGTAAPGTSGLASRQDHVHPSSGGGLPAQPSTTFLGADVASSGTANTWVTVLTLGAVLTAGASYLLSGKITILLGTLAASYNLSFEIFDSTNSVAIAQAELVGLTSTQNGLSYEISLPPVYYTGYAGTPTIILRFTQNTGTSVMTAKAANASNSGGNISTWITAIRTA